MTQQIARFTDFIDEYKQTIESDKPSAQIANKLVLSCEKEASEMLSDARTQLNHEIEQLFNYLMNSQNETLLLMACDLVSSFVNQRMILIQNQQLYDYAMILVVDKRKKIAIAAAQSLTHLVNIASNFLESTVNSIFEIFKNNQTKINAIILVNQLLSLDQQLFIKKISQKPTFIQEVYQYILDCKDRENQQLTIQAYSQLICLRNCQFHLINTLDTQFTNQSVNQHQLQVILSILNQLLSTLQQNSSNKQFYPIIQLLNERYVQIVQNVLLCCISNSSSREVLQNAMALLPLLARQNVEVFVHSEYNFLQQFLDFLLRLKATEAAHIGTISQLALIIGEEAIKPSFDKIVKVLLDNLTPETQKYGGDTVTSEVLNCINSLAQVAPKLLQQHMENILAAIFSQGLSEELLQALMTLKKNNVEQFINLIEEKLFLLIGTELMGVDVYNLKTILNLSFSSTIKFKHNSHAPKTLLALQAFYQFDFNQFELQSFCSDCIIKYINGPTPQQRIFACNAIIKHLVKSQYTQVSNLMIVYGLIAQILIIGLTDVSDEVRKSITMHLNESSQYDNVLAQKENLDVLFIGVNDRCFQVRNQVVAIIGRLSSIHPVLVLPNVRDILVSLIFETEYSQDDSIKAENVQLLQTIIKYCCKLIEPFIMQICQTIIQILKFYRERKNVSNNLIINCLKCLQEVYQQIGDDLIQFMEDITQFCVYILQKDSGKELKIETLNMIIALVQGTGLPVIPYFLSNQSSKSSKSSKHHTSKQVQDVNLLNVLINIIKKEQDVDLSQIACKTLVTVGAVDHEVTYKIHQQFTLDNIKKIKETNIDTQFEPLQLFIEQHIVSQQLVSHGPGIIDKITDQIIDQNKVIKIYNKESQQQQRYQNQDQQLDYVNFTLKIVHRMLSDVSQQHYYQDLIIIFRKIIGYLQFLPYLNPQNNVIIEEIINRIFVIIHNSKKVVMQESLLKQAIYIVSALNPNIRSYLDQVFQLCYDLWDVKELTSLIFNLLEEVILKFPGYDFIQQNAQIFKKMLQYYSQPEESKGVEQELVIRSFNTLVVLLPCLKNQIRILLPCLLRLSENFKNKRLSIATLDCIGRIACTCQIGQIQSQLIQTLINIMQNSYEHYKAQISEVDLRNSQILTYSGINPLSQSQSGQQKSSTFMNHYKVNEVGYKAFETLHYVALNMHLQFNVYIPTVNKVLAECCYFSPVFNLLVTLCLRQQQEQLMYNYTSLLGLIQSFKSYVCKHIGNSVLDEFVAPPVRAPTPQGQTVQPSTLAGLAGIPGITGIPGVSTHLGHTANTTSSVNLAAALQMDVPGQFNEGVVIPQSQLLNFHIDSTVEQFLQQLAEQKHDSLFNSIEPLPPHAIGMEALPQLEVEPGVEAMQKKIWMCDEIEEGYIWRKWLEKLQLNLVRHAPHEVLRYFGDICGRNSKVAGELFNHAFLSYVTDQQLQNDVKVTIYSSLRGCLSSKTIPKDILQQLLDLLEFLEHNGEASFGALGSLGSLGDISESCYAYARSLRYREVEYATTPQATTDLLVRLNKRLGNFEGSKGLVFIEMERLNHSSLRLLQELLFKKTTEITQFLMQNPTLVADTEKLEIELQKTLPELVQAEAKNIRPTHTDSSHQFSSYSGHSGGSGLSGGVLGGVYLEGRNVTAGLTSVIGHCDWRAVAEFVAASAIELQTESLISAFGTDHGFRSIAEDIIVPLLLNQFDQLLKQALTHTFGPKPQWFESLNWYDKAFQGYSEQAAVISSIIGDLKGTQLKEALKQHQTLSYQKITCMYHLGNYQKVVELAQAYDQTIKQLSALSEQKQGQYIERFHIYVARFVIQSLIELKEKNEDVIKHWFSYLDCNLSVQKLIIQAIHYIQQAQLQRAEQMITEVINQLISPIVAGTLESYERAYDNFIQLHQCIELQEVIKYKTLDQQLRYRQIAVSQDYLLARERENKLLMQNYKLKQIWNLRLANLQHDLDIWISVLRVRQLVLDKNKDIPVYVQFALKCMAVGRQQLAKNTLEGLLEFQLDLNQTGIQFKYDRNSKQYYLVDNGISQMLPTIVSVKYDVVYCYTKYLYQTNDPALKIAAFIYLLRLASDLKGNALVHQQKLSKTMTQAAQTTHLNQQSQNIDLLQKIYIRLADWYSELVFCLRQEAGMISIGQSTIVQETSFHDITVSAIERIMLSLRECDITSSGPQSTALSGAQTPHEIDLGSGMPTIGGVVDGVNDPLNDMKIYKDRDVNKIVAMFITDLIKKQKLAVEDEPWNDVIPGILDAKYAMHWFEEAEKSGDISLQVQRCIAHISGYIVDLIDRYQKKQRQEHTNDQTNSPSASMTSLTSAPPSFMSDGHRNSSDGIISTQMSAKSGPLQNINNQGANSEKEKLERHKQQFLIQSLKAHFRCIRYPQIQLPSALRLLTLWFTFGNDSQVEDEVVRGLAGLDIDVWLEVVPQLIARSTSSNRKIKYLIQQLLIQIGLKHPQLLVFPLLVATKREQINQQSEALSILDQIRRAHQAELDECIKFGRELVRVSMLWAEACVDELFLMLTEYSQTRNQSALLRRLSVQIQRFTRTPETPAEQQFSIMCVPQLAAAFGSLKTGVLNKDLQLIEQCRQTLQDVYNKLKQQISVHDNLDLQHTSPFLAGLRNSCVFLPGNTDGSIRVNRIIQKLNVIASKQRPRKTAFLATNGEIYGYLLKGHEDLRLDERVMQLMGLVNQLLQSDSFAVKQQLHITRYPVLPIGRNAGLLFWVPFCDTVNDLVKEYRQQKNYQENAEERYLIQRSGVYTQLSLKMKVEAFRSVFRTVPGVDLRAVFWERSANSESWLGRRTCFTTSLAVMSIVGYVLGLGDRHPANIMITRARGQVVHIDYGDCFEACQRRALLPEKVPFRLTRMLVNAMEACGACGLFQKAAEVTTRLLRNNRDSIMAVLQTFVHDPLLGWGAVNGAGSGTLAGEAVASPQEVPGAAPLRADDGLSGVSPVAVTRRIEDKLVGRDFPGYPILSVEEQVQALVHQAQALENLCQHYFGWCPLW